MPGASLLGVVGPDGQLDRFGTPIPIDASFIEAAETGGDLGRRFRFAAPCAGGECRHWTGTACGLIGEIRERAVRLGLPGEPALPRCALRPACRWWQQDGAASCSVCSLVVYNPAPRDRD